jgi:hypothetical protein
VGALARLGGTPMGPKMCPPPFQSAAESQSIFLLSQISDSASTRVQRGFTRRQHFGFK